MMMKSIKSSSSILLLLVLASSGGGRTNVEAFAPPSASSSHHAGRRRTRVPSFSLRKHNINNKQKQKQHSSPLVVLQQSDFALPLSSSVQRNSTGTTTLIPPLLQQEEETNVGVVQLEPTEAQAHQEAFPVVVGVNDNDDNDADAVTIITDETPQGRWLTSIDGIVFVSYLCNVMALSMPVLLVPLAAHETLAAAAATATTSGIVSLNHVAAAVAGVSSIATLGGAVGKFVNGFICQAVGSYTCSTVYFAGLAACSFLFSLAQSPLTMGWAYAGMEFFASIQWAALAVMLSQYYNRAPVKLAAALTALGLASTSGQIVAKTVGTTLAAHWHWRTVAQVGAVTATLGSLLMAQAPKPAKQSKQTQQQKSQKFQWSSVTTSLKAVLGSRLFWMLAVAHAMAFVARGTDRILGTFFQHAAGHLQLPGALAGGLTLSVTLGLVHGLITGQKQYVAAATVPGRRQFLQKRYVRSVAATLGLVATAQWGHTLIASPLLRTAVIALLSGTMASNVAFQYFQFPAKIAKSKFAEHQAVVISFLDGFGFLFSAPIFALCGRLVPTLGWGSAWTMLAGLFGGAALLMLRAIGPVLEAEQTLEQEAAAAAAS